MNGHLGLGPDIVQAGDVLCVLNSGDMPFVRIPCCSRRYPEHRRESAQNIADENTHKYVGGSRYLLIGECYVESMMTGEAVEHLREAFPSARPVRIYL